MSQTAFVARSSSGADASTRSPGHISASKRQGPDADDAYPSSESDADIEGDAPSKESRPLLPPGDGADKQSFAQHPIASAQAASISPVPSTKRRTPLKWTEVVWVTLTLLLIAILGYSSQLCIILPYYLSTPSFSPFSLFVLLAPFNLGLGGIFYNYYLCVSTDPGSVPPNWQPEWSALDPQPPSSSHQERDASLELKETILRPRYCKTCSAYKPPRSHHCKTCQRCVLRMDHHCPWLANCVGHYNYASFIRFLFWVDVTCLYHLAMISARVLDRFNTYGYWREPGMREVVWLVINYALCIPVILLVGIFSGYHFYCVAINQTTIESWEKDRTATMIRRGRIRRVKYPYNLGFWRNVRTMLGDNVLTWCLPKGRGGREMGDGLKYPVAPGLDEGSQYRWPPKDPTRSSTIPSMYGWHNQVIPPGATSTSAFTYGDGGFNPNLQPTNSSSSLRNRFPSHSQTQEESESSISTESDYEYHPHPPPNLYHPTAQDLSTLTGYHQNPFAEDQHDDMAPRVTIRRGSEGYEVRPRNAWVV